jgi:hypothetical protein
MNQTIAASLAAPFAASEIHFTPAAASGSRALAIPYLDARSIMDRLDQVCGVEGWNDAYRVLPDGAVVCRLSLKIDETWISKSDVGGPSEQPDGGDRLKAAFSDALKRTAVKFGIGRYLYRLPQQWCEWDSKRKRFVQLPQLPGAAPATISREQGALLASAIRQSGQDGKAILERFGIARLGELPAGRFAEFQAACRLAVNGVPARRNLP